MKLERNIILYSLLAFVGLGGCAKLPAKATFSQAEQIPLEPLSAISVLYLADNQKALLTSEPIHEQSIFAEKTVGTAHRRAALDSFSLDIVKHILNERGKDASIVIHGGDLINNSCRLEFERAKLAMDSAHKPWFIAPGNHDGYYLGISSPTMTEDRLFPLDTLVGWAQVCVPSHKKESGKAFLSKESLAGDSGYYSRFVMDKYSFTQSYKDILLEDKPPVALQQDRHATEKVTNKVVMCAELDESKPATQAGRWKYLKKACWTQSNVGTRDTNSYDLKPDGRYVLFDNKPWHNFIVQWLAISIADKQVDLIILDTANYADNMIGDDEGRQLPAEFISGGAASEANIGDGQWAVLERWINEIKQHGSTQVIVIGHHPLNDFNEGSRNKLRQFFNELPVSHYISGDTHDGYDVRHQTFQNSNGGLVREANIGSTIDAPIEYASLGVAPKSHTNEIDIRRFFLTPNRNFNEKYLKDSTYRLEKNYGNVADSWTEACKEFQPFDPLAPPYAPFARVETTGMPTPKYPRLRQPAYYMGLPYLFAPLTVKDVRTRSLQVYKINRLLDMLEVYEGLYEYAGIKMTPEQKQTKQDIANNVQKLSSRTANFKAFALEKNDIGETMNKLAEFVDGLECASLNAPQTEVVGRYRLCSALFEARLEEKVGPGENAD